MVCVRACVYVTTSLPEIGVFFYFSYVSNTLNQTLVLLSSLLQVHSKLSHIQQYTFLCPGLVIEGKINLHGILSVQHSKG